MSDPHDFTREPSPPQAEPASFEGQIQIDPNANHPSATQWIVIVTIGLIAICGIALFLAGGAFTTYSYATRQQTQATQTSVAAAAIAEQRQRDFAAAANWPLLLFDPFDNNQNDWIIGPVDDDYATIEIGLEGAYTWDVQTVKQGFAWRVWPASDPVRNFYLAVDARNLSQNQDAQYGLIFHNRGDNYFYFEARDSQYIRLFKYEASQWLELLPFTFSAAIRPGEFNRLAVFSQDGRITLWVNDQFVGQAYADSAAEGKVGVIIGLSNAGETGHIAFDNFEVRVPESEE